MKSDSGSPIFNRKESFLSPKAKQELEISDQIEAYIGEIERFSKDNNVSDAFYVQSTLWTDEDLPTNMKRILSSIPPEELSRTKQKLESIKVASEVINKLWFTILDTSPKIGNSIVQMFKLNTKSSAEHAIGYVIEWAKMFSGHVDALGMKAIGMQTRLDFPKLCDDLKAASIIIAPNGKVTLDSGGVEAIKKLFSVMMTEPTTKLSEWLNQSYDSEIPLLYGNLADDAND